MEERGPVARADVLEVGGRWEGELGDGLLVPLTYCDETRALNIPAKFRGWLSEHRKEGGGLPRVEDVEKWKLHGLDLDDLPVE
ncbi:unnamed protein product [Prunus armeniaca]